MKKTEESIINQNTRMCVDVLRQYIVLLAVVHSSSSQCIQTMIVTHMITIGQEIFAVENVYG